LHDFGTSSKGRQRRTCGALAARPTHRTLGECQLRVPFNCNGTLGAYLQLERKSLRKHSGDTTPGEACWVETTLFRQAARNDITTATNETPGPIYKGARQGVYYLEGKPTWEDRTCDEGKKPALQRERGATGAKKTCPAAGGRRLHAQGAAKLGRGKLRVNRLRGVSGNTESMFPFAGGLRISPETKQRGATIK